MNKFVVHCLLLLVAMLLQPSYATVSKLASTTTSTTKEPTELQDSYGRDTPRSTMQGFIHALAEGDDKTTAHYLDDKFVKNYGQSATIKNLKNALDKGGRLQSNLAISDKPEGNLADKLPSNEEKVGTITVGDKEVDLLLTRHENKQSVAYWQISTKTLKLIPRTGQTQVETLAGAFGLNFLKGKYVFGQDLVDVATLVILLAIGFLIVWVIVWLFYGLTAFIYPKLSKKEFGITPKVVLPLSFVILAYLLPELMVGAGVPVTLRSAVIRAKDVVAWLAIAWLILRVIDTVFGRAEARSMRKNRPEQVSILHLLKKIAKAFMVILAVIVIFGSLGFDLTTGIAALGVGGIALAFGAQKTIENLIGSVVVVADRPVHVGDFCRFGNQEGTVIDIGIRSSRIRTLNRTVVTVPNGEFSAMQIENYSARDMFYFYHFLYLSREAEPTEVGRLVKGLQNFLENHQHTNDEWTLVRISEIRQDCFVVEMRCYIGAVDVSDFYRKQSDLIVDVLSEVKNYNVAHALPSQEIHLKNNHPDGGASLVESKV